MFLEEWKSRIRSLGKATARRSQGCMNSLFVNEKDMVWEMSAMEHRRACKATWTGKAETSVLSN